MVGYQGIHPLSLTSVPKKILFLVPKSGLSYHHFTDDVNDSAGVDMMLLYIHSDILTTICYHVELSKQSYSVTLGLQLLSSRAYSTISILAEPERQARLKFFYDLKCLQRDPNPNQAGVQRHPLKPRRTIQR